MITQQDLKILDRLCSPFSKILLEHLRVDHGYVPILEGLSKNDLLRNEVSELTSELKSLKFDYEALREIHNSSFDPGKGMV